MEKRRVIGLVLSFVLVFTTVFAGAGSVSAGTTYNRGLPADKELRIKASQGTTLKAKYLQYSTSQKPDRVLFLAENYKNRWYIPVVAQETGKLYLDASVPGDSESPMVVKVYKSRDDMLNDENWVDYAKINVKKIVKGIGGLDVKKGETYYIGYETYDAGEDAEIVSCMAGVRVCAYIYSYSSNRTIPVGNTLLSSGKKGDGASAIWYKIKPSKTGVISVILTKPNGGDYNWGTVRLYNAKKKALSDPVDFDASYDRYKVYFGVKKNTTYYLKVTEPGAAYNFKGMFAYGIKFTQTARIDRAIGTKAKAKKLVRKANATNTLFVASTSKSTDWYKFYVSSKRTTKISLNTSGIKSGNVYVTLYRGAKKIDDTIKIKAGDSESIKVEYGSTAGKANSGWYYVKVVKGTKASGKYSIRYVK